MADKFTLSIGLGNEAMDDHLALADALEAVANRMRSAGFEGDVKGIVRDVNGNTVGRWELNNEGAEPDPLDFADQPDMRHEHDPSL